MSMWPRFRDLNLSNISVDWHIHTDWTDGDESVRSIIDGSIREGLISIAFTEHIRRESDYFDSFLVEIDEERRKNSIQVYAGVEAKVINERGELDASDDVLHKAEIVIGSVHRIPVGDDFSSPDVFSKEELFEREYGLSLGLIARGQADVLGHPAGMSIKTHGAFPIHMLEDMIRQISATNMAWEWNSKYMTLELQSVLKELCLKYNPYVSLGSDVHSNADLGKCYHMMKDIIC